MCEIFLMLLCCGVAVIVLMQFDEIAAFETMT